MEIVKSIILKLEENNGYIVKFIDNKFYDSEELYLIKIITKFENSVVVLFVNTNTQKIFPLYQELYIFDHVEEKYFRKLKLDEIKKGIK